MNFLSPIIQGLTTGPFHSNEKNWDKARVQDVGESFLHSLLVCCRNDLM